MLLNVTAFVMVPPALKMTPKADAAAVNEVAVTASLKVTLPVVSVMATVVAATDPENVVAAESAIVNVPTFEIWPEVIVPPLPPFSVRLCPPPAIVFNWMFPPVGTAPTLVVSSNTEPV